MFLFSHLGGNLRAADQTTAAVYAGPHGSAIHLEAIDPHVLRLWIAREGAKKRAKSLALSDAPAASGKLTTRENAGEIAAQTQALALRLDLKTLEFAVTDRATNAALFRSGSFTLGKGKVEWSMTRSLADGERLLGLGQDNQNHGRLDRRGVIRELWAGQQINSGNVTAEYAVPLMISVLADGTAYGLFFDNAHRLRFDLGKTKADELKLDAPGGEVDLYFIAGPRIADVIERYTRMTGRPSLPPLWALGYWQSKCTYYDWRALGSAYEQLTARGFPVDVMVIDYDWPEFMNNFQWAKRWYVGEKTPADIIAEYAKKGVKIVVSQSGPMVKQESPTFATGWAAGVFAKDGAGNPVEAGHFGGKLLDFTHPGMNDWLWPQLRARLRDGISGWWLDLTEPEGEPPHTRYYRGSPAEVHNEYSQLVTRSFEGAQLAESPDLRPFILTRAGSAGTQAHHAAVWTGDVYSDYATLRAHAPEMLNSGLSGLTWWTSDSGGFMEGYYKNDQMGAHARLYERWMQLSVFSPITRAHKAGGLPEPYQFGTAVEQSSLHYLKLRYRLIPYIYSHAWEASQTGLPIARPLGLEFQDDPKALAAPGDSYLFGRSLLVAPVLFEGLTNRTVYLPAGKWIDWDYGYEYEGGREWVVAAPQNRIPVIVRPGAIIPLAPEMRTTSEKPWDPLTLEIFPAGKSQFTLYNDDGRSFGYSRGEHTVTTITSDASADAVLLTVDEANKRFTPAEYLMRFHLSAVPREVVTDQGAKLEHAWNAEERVLSVKVPAPKSMMKHIVKVSLGEKLPPRPAPILKADVIDPSGEAKGSGKPIPHFFPATALPNRIKAINYDKGGEGTAFHTTRPMPAKTRYRADDFSIVEGADAGGDYVIGGLRTGEWMRYTIDAKNGGHFDLTVRVASASGGGRMQLLERDRVVANIDVPATGGDSTFKDVTVPGVYVNPGEQTLMVYVEKPGFVLNAFTFQEMKERPSVYPAVLGQRRGTCEVTQFGEGTASRSVLDKLGRKGSGVTYGIWSPVTGRGGLRLHYRNTTGKPVKISVAIGDAAPVPVLAEPTAGDDWSTLDVAGVFAVGTNRVDIAGLEETWNMIMLDKLKLIASKP